MSFSLTKSVSFMKKIFEEKEPEIYVTLGIVGVLVTTGLTAYETVKTVKQIEVIKKEKEENNESDETYKIKVAKTVVRRCFPVIVTGGASIYAILKATDIYTNRLAVIAAAYKLSETNIKELREQMSTVLGEKQEKKVNDALAQKRTDANPPVPEQIEVTGNGETLCREELTGRYFKSNRQAIESAVNTLNYEAMSSMWTSVNDFFDKIEISECQLGDDLGWSIESGLIEPIFSSALTPDGTPILVVDFRILPSPRPKHII